MVHPPRGRRRRLLAVTAAGLTLAVGGSPAVPAARAEVGDGGDQHAVNLRVRVPGRTTLAASVPLEVTASSELDGVVDTPFAGTVSFGPSRAAVLRAPTAVLFFSGIAGEARTIRVRLSATARRTLRADAKRAAEKRTGKTSVVAYVQAIGRAPGRPQASPTRQTFGLRVPSPSSASAGHDTAMRGAPATQARPARGSSRSMPMGRTFACNQPYVVVQALPSGFVVGNCLRGVHLRRQLKSDAYNASYWNGGWIFGNYGGCGWVNSSYATEANPQTQSLCGGNSLAMAQPSYMAASNEATDEATQGSCSASDGRCTDGTLTSTTATCTAYGNYRPWLPGQSPTDPIRSLPAGTPLRWRYLARYDYPSGTGQTMVMTRDPGIATGQGNWAWVHSSCLAGFPGLTRDLG